jgi:hypothetical protein
MEKKLFKIVSTALIVALLAAPLSFGTVSSNRGEVLGTPAQANYEAEAPPFSTPGGVAAGAPPFTTPGGVLPGTLPADRAASPGAVVTVKDFASFETAVKDDGVAEVVIDADITIERKIEATRNNDLTIRGADKSHLLIEDEKLPANAMDFTMTFRGNYKNITFSAIGIKGHSYGASVNAPVKDARVVFDNVTYVGPALYHGVVTGNTGVIKDSDITLRVLNEKVKYTSEAMHAFNVELVGNVRITKEEESGEDYDEVFYFSLPDGDLTVAENADVKIVNLSKAAGSVYWSGLLFIEGGNANKHSFVVRDGARFGYDGAGGCILEQWPLDKFAIGKGAEVNMRLGVPGGKSMFRRDDNGAYFRAKEIVLAEGAVWNYTLRGDVGERRDALLGAENLTVDENAVLRVKAPENVKGEDILRFYGKKPRMTLNKPKEVLLYNGARTFTPVSALSAAQAGDGYGVLAAGPIELNFTGKGIRAWNAGKEKIGIDDNWKVDTAAAHGEWGVPASQGNLFTLTAAVGNDGALIDPSSKPHAGSAPPNPDPADPHPQRGLKSFANKSVIQFDGEGHIIGAPDAEKPGVNVPESAPADKPGTETGGGAPTDEPGGEIAKPQPPAAAPAPVVPKPPEAAPAPDAGKGGEAQKPNESGKPENPGAAGNSGAGSGGGSSVKPGGSGGGAGTTPGGSGGKHGKPSGSSTAKPGKPGGGSSIKPGNPGSDSNVKPGGSNAPAGKPENGKSGFGNAKPGNVKPGNAGKNEWTVGKAATEPDDERVTPGGISGGKGGGAIGGKSDGGGSTRSESGARGRNESGVYKSDPRAVSIVGSLRAADASADGENGIRGQGRRNQGPNAQGERSGLETPNAAQGSAWALVNLLIAALCTILAAATAVRLAFGRENEEAPENGEGTRAALRNLSVIAGISAPVAFLLTEDIRSSMVTVDRWTLLMAAIFAIQAILMAMASAADDARESGI